MISTIQCDDTAISAVLVRMSLKLRIAGGNRCPLNPGNSSLTPKFQIVSGTNVFLRLVVQCLMSLSTFVCIVNFLD